uniref:Uncharacterized protein n=3 Tax=Oryza TaxID=4527 RepID=A0A0D3ETY6_9ORYZ
MLKSEQSSSAQDWRFLYVIEIANVAPVQ